MCSSSRIVEAECGPLVSASCAQHITLTLTTRMRKSEQRSRGRPKRTVINLSPLARGLLP